ncbi:MAG: hypothetical protein JRD04_13535, partial [Deltaproteobacteria bacterium]|nr:hypothetical protein [Deltaproteobacteria bacterium]
MKRIILTSLVATCLLFAACSSDKETATKASSDAAPTTTVTDENYGLAETQVIIAGYVKKIAAATGSNGMGVWMNNKKGANPKDRDVMRKNYDT